MILIQNYSLNEILSMSQTELEQLIASEGVIVDKIEEHGIYYNDNLSKMIAIVKNNILTELKRGKISGLKADVAIADSKIGIKQLKKEEKNKIKGIADVINFTYDKTKNMLSQIEDINKKTFRGQKILLPTLSETADIIDIVQRYPKSYTLLYWKGLHETKKILQEYQPIRELNLQYTDSEVKRALKNFKWQSIRHMRLIFKQDLDNFLEALKK
jgi:hypothetical protein